MPLLVRYSRVREVADGEMYLSTVTVFLNEAVKLLVCLLILAFFVEPSLASMLHSLKSAIVDNPGETLKVCVPSFIYMIQNNLYFVALSNLDATTYCVTYQLKILTTALFFVWMLGRRLSRVQWGSLCLLMGGVALVQLQQGDGSASKAAAAAEESGQNRAVGLAAVLTMCLTSGFAGVYFEKVLKGSKTNLWVQNVRLALLGIPLTLLTMLAKDWKAVVEEGGMFRGIDGLVWATVLLNAAGGLIIAVVIKYADNILKAYSQSAAIVCACFASMLLLNFQPSQSFLLGSALVIASVYLYARFPPPPTSPASPVKSKEDYSQTSLPFTDESPPPSPPLLVCVGAGGGGGGQHLTAVQQS